MSKKMSDADASSQFYTTRKMILSRVLLSPFITVLLVCSFLVYYFAITVRSQLKEDMTRIVRIHRNLIESFLAERATDLQFLADVFTFDEIIDSDQLQKLFTQLQKRSAAFSDIGIFDAAGKHLAYEGPHRQLAGKNYAEADWFKSVQEKGIFVSDVFLGYRKTPHFIIAVRSENNGKTWYIRATIDTLYFQDIVENIQVSKTGEAYLVNENGLLQTHRRSGGELMDEDSDFLTYQIGERGILSYSADDHRGERYLYATGRLAETGWLLIVRMELFDVYRPLIEAIIVSIVIILSGGVIIIFLTFMLATSLANRLSLADYEKKEMGSQLIMAGKLAELGEMSAGIAHEINNPLQIMKSEYTLIRDIISDVEKMNRPLDAEESRLVKDSIEQFSIQIDRCSSITQGLLKFARKSEPQSLPIIIPDFLKEVVGMIESRAHLAGVKISVDTEQNLPELYSSPEHLQQVFLNLLNNALYAQKDRPDPLITIKARQQEREIHISIADNGVGIPPENLEKIFMPFFTTKPVGKGTGLGLSTCYGIIERLGGHITVSSELHGGSVFTIVLPFQSRVRERSTDQYNHYSIQ